MGARIDSIRQRATNTGERTISSDAAERLRALGYVAGSAQRSGKEDAPHPASKIDAWNQFEDALTALNARQVDAAVTALARLAAANPEAPVFQTTVRSRASGKRTVVARAGGVPARSEALTNGRLASARSGRCRARGRRQNDGSASSHIARRSRACRPGRAGISPKSATARNGLGLLAIDQDWPQDAVKEFEQATTIDPTNASYWANLGNARRAVHDSAGAEQAYRRALEVDPRTADAVNGLGVLLVETQRPAEAVPLFERAVAVAPDFQEARLNLGIALQQSGQAARAVDTYRQVLQARGNHPREKEAATQLLRALGATR